MRLKFTKMHGLGNDFVVFDATHAWLELSREQLRRISDPHFGVGCDQILLVEQPRQPDTDFYYRIFNADGSEVEQCGNGARCFVRYVREHGLTGKIEIRVGTLDGVIVPRLGADGQVTVNMGVPEFDPSRIPFQAERRAPTYMLDVGGRQVEICALSMGNPHAVQFVPDVERAPVQTEGAAIEVHPRFPQRVNAGYVQVVNRGHIRLRVFERGAGETLACGTGACAAVVAGIRLGWLDARVDIDMHGGRLTVEWAGGPDDSVFLTGPATTVFEGEIEL
jgi:diaminopimelate epimerase